MHAVKNFLPVCNPHRKKKKKEKKKKKKKKRKGKEEKRKKERKKGDVFDAGLSRQDVEGMWIA